MSSPNQYDVSAKELEILKWRKARREQLRREYYKEIQEPNRTEVVPEKAFLHYSATRTFLEKIALPPAQQMILHGGVIAGLISLTAWFLLRNKERREQAYRTGQISYKDRQFKFH